LDAGWVVMTAMSQPAAAAGVGELGREQRVYGRPGGGVRARSLHR
jgi:hypothetical protein